MTQVDLARASGVSSRTVASIELGETTPHPATIKVLVDALEQHGIVFTNGDRPGFYLNKAKLDPSAAEPS